ncbi:MAG: RNA methyltransferase [Sinobacteraceae bacterium]|nr:RNA methyltransferase [Nevskiaceae bacterium]
MKLADLSKLHQRKYRAASGHYLIEGEHLALELQKAAAVQPGLRQSELYVTEAYRNWASPFVTHVVNEAQMRKLADTESPQGIVGCVPVLPPVAAAAHQRAVYLHEIQDPGNLGTILRTLSWFGRLRCLLSAGSVDPYNLKAVRASAGAIFHVPIETDVPFSQLRERFARLAILGLSGASIHTAAFREFDCYVFGNEARGLPPAHTEALAATPFTIPGAAAIESLNLATAVSISVYELSC